MKHIMKLEFELTEEEYKNFGKVYTRDELLNFIGNRNIDLEIKSTPTTDKERFPTLKDV